jgi:hypothetical protein
MMIGYFSVLNESEGRGTLEPGEWVCGTNYKV